jgi:LysR family nod box-dependent transcriptional activator
VNRAAEELNMSQSAASDALKRLRAHFGDDLLVRHGGVMELTETAELMRPKVEGAMEEAENLLNPTDLDLALLRREFVIATDDSISIVLAGKILRQLVSQVPGVSARFVDLQWIDQKMLESGEIDFIVMPDVAASTGLSMPAIDTTRLHSSPMFEESFVCILRNFHPASEDVLNDDIIDAYPSVAFCPDSDGPILALNPGKRRHHQILVPYYTQIPFMVEKSDAIAIMPRHLAEYFESFLDIQLRKPPQQTPNSKISAFWAPFHQNDPAHQWFRRVLELSRPGEGFSAH